MAKKAATTGSIALHGYAPYVEKKGEEYMSPNQQEHFKKLLMAWKQELMEEVDRTVSHMKDEAANFPDPADRATQEEEFSLELRTRDRERKLIKKIDSTLERIENDDYGFCDQCGIEIGIRRLEARPTASLCVDLPHPTPLSNEPSLLRSLCALTHGASAFRFPDHCAGQLSPRPPAGWQMAGADGRPGSPQRNAGRRHTDPQAAGTARVQLGRRGDVPEYPTSPLPGNSC
jgi:DnaK suppressor protein